MDFLILSPKIKNIYIDNLIEVIMEKRADIRNRTALKVGISFFASNFDEGQEIATICNCSSNGIVVESERWYPEGSILLVTLHNIPNNASHLIGETGIKSICLAQVKWLKSPEPNRFSHYKLGLRYVQ